jgi:hypothetical protein
LVFQSSLSYTALYSASRSASLLNRRIHTNTESSVSPLKLRAFIDFLQRHSRRAKAVTEVVLT